MHQLQKVLGWVGTHQSIFCFAKNEASDHLGIKLIEEVFLTNYQPTTDNVDLKVYSHQAKAGAKVKKIKEQVKKIEE